MDGSWWQGLHLRGLIQWFNTDLSLFWQIKLSYSGQLGAGGPVCLLYDTVRLRWMNTDRQTHICYLTCSGPYNGCKFVLISILNNNLGFFAPKYFWLIKLSPYQLRHCLFIKVCLNLAKIRKINCLSLTNISDDWEQVTFFKYIFYKHMLVATVQFEMFRLHKEGWTGELLVTGRAAKHLLRDNCQGLLLVAQQRWDYLPDEVGTEERDTLPWWMESREKGA